MSKQLQDKIITVKLSFPYDWPIMRQTPNWSGKWENYQFFLNDEVEECDFWIIFSKYNLKKTAAFCPPENVIFMPSECFSIAQFKSSFLKQFATVITCQREIKHHHKILDVPALPWFVGKSYDELKALAPMEKTKKISLITSNKVQTEGHKKRLDFAYKLKDYFKEDIDLFGRGINDFDDKWDVLASYQYSIAIENDSCDDWVTEKFYDCHLAYTYPFYYGCPNLEKYFNPKSFTRINIDNFDESIRTIDYILNDSNHYQQSIPYLSEARNNKLDQYNLFPFLVGHMERMNADAKKSKVTIKPELLSTLKASLYKLWS